MMKKFLSLLVFFASLTMVSAVDVDPYIRIDLSGGPGAKSYKWDYVKDAPDSSDPDAWDKARTSELWLKLIPESGSFTMGSPASEVGRDTSEIQHSVTLEKIYFIGLFPVTQRQWELVMGTRPSYFNQDECYGMRPVESVSYDMIRGTDTLWPDGGHAVSAGSFLAILREKTGLELDLPTEAQWECACRKNETGFETGALRGLANLESEKQSDTLEALARYGYNGGQATHRDYDTDNGTNSVGSYAPNGYGLYDMNGNVWEWCLDWYGDFSEAAATNPTGPATTDMTKRVLRGGGWGYIAKCCRNASRYGAKSNAAFYDHGFRLACNTDAGDTINLTVNLKRGDDKSQTVDGAQWYVEGDSTKHNSGEMAAVPVGVCTIKFTGSTGYATPGDKSIRVFTDTTQDITYDKLYNLTMNVEPSSAKWYVNGQEYASGATAQVVNGKYDISFSAVDKYAAHGIQSVEVKDADLTVVSGYVPISADDTYLKVNLDDFSVTRSATGPNLNDDACRTSELWLRKVPCGTFKMGYPKSEETRYDYEKPVQVELTKSFYVGILEITQAQWLKVMGEDKNPSFFVGPEGSKTLTRPVEQVSFDSIRGDATPIDESTFIGQLKKKIGEKLDTRVMFFRYDIDLPTEAQWEYCCKLKQDGTCYESALNSGENLTGQLRCPNLAMLGRYWYNGGMSYTATSDTTLGTAKVGSYAASNIGLCDMHGNVQEWCRDWYAAYDYTKAKLTDPVGPDEGTRRVVRGGHWGDFAQYCSCHWRGSFYPSIQYFGCGFRIVMTPADFD